MWNALWPPPTITRQAKARFELLEFAGGDLQKSNRPLLRAEPDETGVERLNGLMDVLARTDDLVNWQQPPVILECPEDPALQWRRFEQLISPRVAALYSETYLAEVLHSQEVPTALRCQFAACMGNLGCSPYESRITAQIASVPDRDLIEATLLSRWVRPTEDRHADSCLTYLKQVLKADRAHDCVSETLIRLHRVDDIPPESLSTWFDHQVTATPYAGVRWKALVLITASKSGRRWIQARVNNDAPEKVRADLQSVLISRVKAARATGRFENLSREECESLLPLSNAEAMP